MDTREFMDSPVSSLSNGSMFVSSPEGSPPPSPERSPGVGLPRGLLSMQAPVAVGPVHIPTLRVGRASEDVSPMRPSWLGPNNTGENDEVDFPPGYITRQQEQDLVQAAADRAEAAAQTNANTRSAIQGAIQAEYIPPEAVSRGVFKSLSNMRPPPPPRRSGSPAPFGFGRSRAVPAPMFMPAARRVSTPRAMGGKRGKKTLKRRKTKNNRRRRASKTR